MLGLVNRKLFNQIYSRLSFFSSSSNQEVFDHIIIGSGSAGSVLAKTLSEAGKSVALFQAGGSNDAQIIHQYNQQPISQPQYVWNYKSINQVGMNNRQISYSCGRVQGGSSSINGMVWVHGCSKDYDDWGQPLWSSSTIKSALKQIQNYPGISPYRGHKLLPNSNLTHITTQYSRSDVSKMLLQGANRAGVKTNDDYNGVNQYGVCLNQLNVGDGTSSSQKQYRQDAYSIYAKGRANIKIFTQCPIETIVLQGTNQKKAVGVNYTNSSKSIFARSRSSIYVCAGTFGSPYLLMKSGIGDPAELSKANIPVKVNLPSVGKNLHDHTIATCARTISSSVPQPNFTMQNVLFLADSLKQFSGQPRYELQSFYLKKSYWWKQETSIGLGVLNLHPKSRGKVGLTQKGEITIDPACFVEKSDMEDQIKGLQLGRTILKKLQQIYPDKIGEEVWPKKGMSVQDFIRQYSDIDYHPVGSCKLGSVVTDRLQVKGVQNLKVADASVIPKLISGNTNAITMAIGLRAGQLENGKA